jgi:hypothetical protein
VGERTPGTADLKLQMSGLKRTAERNPLGLAVAGAAAGFLAGLIAPSTRVEDERIGPVSDEVKSTAGEAGREAIERGKAVAQEASASAADAARDVGREQGEELAASLRERAQEAVPTSDTSQSPG